MAPNYALGKVYVIRNTENAKLYVGSTVRTLAQRMAQHRKCITSTRTKDNQLLYRNMRELGVAKFYIELVADFPCERCEQLHAEEGRLIREMNTLSPSGYNDRIAGRGLAEYYVDNKEKLIARAAANYAAKKETINANRRVAVISNEERDKRKAYSKDYYERNKQDCIAKTKAYVESHKEAKRLYWREYGIRRRAAKRAAAQPEPEPVAN